MDELNIFDDGGYNYFLLYAIKNSLTYAFDYTTVDGGNPYIWGKNIGYNCTSNYMYYTIYKNNKDINFIFLTSYSGFVINGKIISNDDIICESDVVGKEKEIIDNTIKYYIPDFNL